MAAKPTVEPKTPIPFGESVLRFVEFVNICLLTLSVWFAGGVAAFWVMWGKFGDQKGRLAVAVRSLATHWQIAVLVAVILFFRTAREMLFRIRKLPGGTELDPVQTPAKAQDTTEDAEP